MGFFKPKPLPTTSYGYTPPDGATAHGWCCTDFDCGVSEHQVVRRWPASCDRCGSPADPLFDESWKHEARGVELAWLVRNHPERGGGFNQDNLHIWQVDDALRRQDLLAAGSARADALAYAAERLQSDGSWWSPGAVCLHVVWHDLDAGEIDWAAEDLRFWLGISSTDAIETNHGQQDNARQLIDTTDRFLSRGGASHPLAGPIREACLAVAEAAAPILNHEYAATVRRIAAGG